MHKHGLLHGECVAIGMLAMCDTEVKERIEKVLDKLDLPTKVSFDFDKALSAVTHDKKQNGKAISCVYVKKIGSYEMKDMMADELSERLATLEV